MPIQCLVGTGGCEQAGLPPLPAHLLRWSQRNPAALQVSGSQGRGGYAEGRRQQDPASHPPAHHPHQNRPEHTRHRGMGGAEPYNTLLTT